MLFIMLILVSSYVFRVVFGLDIDVPDSLTLENGAPPSSDGNERGSAQCYCH